MEMKFVRLSLREMNGFSRNPLFLRLHSDRQYHELLYEKALESGSHSPDICGAHFK